MKNAMKAIGCLMLALLMTCTMVCVANAEANTFTFGDNCVELVARFEGCRLNAYKTADGVWAIGYGHTTGVTTGQTLADKDEALELLKKDLTGCAEDVNELIKDGTIGFEMTQNRFDALTAFDFNCGRYNLAKLVKGATAEDVAARLLAYNKCGGRVVKALTLRRTAEQELFLK